VAAPLGLVKTYGVWPVIEISVVSPLTRTESCTRGATTIRCSCEASNRDRKGAHSQGGRYRNSRAGEIRLEYESGARVIARGQRRFY
jgi:hypothetical protein